MLLTDIQLGFSCDPERAEEIVQQTWVRAVRAIGTYDPQRARVVTWLKTIARNEARRLLGREFRQIPLSQVEPQVLTALEQIDTTALPESALERKELQALVHNSVWELKPQHRSVLLQKYMEDRSIAQIAAGNGRSVKATESLLTRARLGFKNVFLRKIEGTGSSGGDTHGG